MEILNKLEELNKKNIKHQNIIKDIWANEEYETLTRKDIVITYIKIFLFTLVFVVFFDFLSSYLFKHIESSADGLFLVALLSKALFISASFFPILFCKKIVLANTKDFLFKKLDEDSEMYLVVTSLLPIIISGGSVFIIMMLSYSNHYSFDAKYYLEILTSCLDVLYFITLFCFSVSSIFHFNSLPTMEKGIKTKQEIKNKKEKHQIQINTNNLKINKYILEYCKTVDDIEYLELLCEEKKLTPVLNKLISLKDEIAKKNGFQNFKEMKVSFIKSKNKCVIVNE